jgi:hypothetical protein
MEPPRPLGKSFGLRNERLRAPACRMIPALLVGSTAKQYNRGAVDLAHFIGLGNQEPPLRFLIIGGYAVAAHGHTRATFDVDFLVRRADRELWGARLAQSGLTLFGETRAFAQFTQGDQGDGLDLMFVQEATFESMWERSEERDFGGTLARVPRWTICWPLSYTRSSKRCPTGLAKTPKMWKHCSGATALIFVSGSMKSCF